MDIPARKTIKLSSIDPRLQTHLRVFKGFRSIPSDSESKNILFIHWLEFCALYCPCFKALFISTLTEELTSTEIQLYSDEIMEQFDRIIVREDLEYLEKQTNKPLFMKFVDRFTKALYTKYKGTTQNNDAILVLAVPLKVRLIHITVNQDGAVNTKDSKEGDVTVHLLSDNGKRYFIYPKRKAYDQIKYDDFETDNYQLGDPNEPAVEVYENPLLQDPVEGNFAEFIQGPSEANQQYTPLVKVKSRTEGSPSTQLAIVSASGCFVVTLITFVVIGFSLS